VQRPWPVEGLLSQTFLRQRIDRILVEEAEVQFADIVGVMWNGEIGNVGGGSVK